MQLLDRVKSNSVEEFMKLIEHQLNTERVAFSDENLTDAIMKFREDPIFDKFVQAGIGIFLLSLLDPSEDLEMLFKATLYMGMNIGFKYASYLHDQHELERIVR